jgi:hypothetical protein
MEFTVPEELFKSMIKRIPSMHMMRVLRDFKIKIPPNVSFKDYSEYLSSKLDDETKRKMFDEYGATLSKTSIFLFKPNATLFRNIGDVYELIDSLGLREYLGKYHSVEVLTRPTLNSVYIDRTHSSLRMFFTTAGKPIRVVAPDGRIRSLKAVIEPVITFWVQENLVDVRIQGNQALAKRVLEEAKVLLKMDDISFVPVRFNDLSFIRTTLTWVDIVGYITLEFRVIGIEKQSYSKLSYSAPRKGRVPAVDLKSIERIKADIEDAFKRGGIRIMNCYIAKDSDKMMSFALNFGVGKIRMLAFSSETDHNFILSNLVKLSERGIPEFEARRRRSLMDYASR